MYISFCIISHGSSNVSILKRLLTLNKTFHLRSSKIVSCGSGRTFSAMVFPPTRYVDVPNVDLLSWTFSGPEYDEDKDVRLSSSC
jgi:hypothetical protein